MMRDWIDRGWRGALVVAYTGLRVYWFVLRPRTRGVVVALWVQGCLLVIRNSYRSKLSLPGGKVGRSEDAVEAAARELREEVGIDIEPSALRFAKTYVVNEDHHEDHTCYFEIEMENAPVVSIDRREVVWAEFRAPEDVEREDLATSLGLYLKDRRE